MSKQKQIDYWTQSAKKDFETMQYLIKGKKFVHALFFGHLYLEKIAKAVWIKSNNENYPPKIHNILSVLQQAKVSLEEKHQLFLLKLNQYQVEGRYPEDIEKLYKITDRKLVAEYVVTIKDIAKCLQKKLR
ncbi:MAG: HEPN domain-containing protein [Bacteroidia bacterium]|nr:HEPN domain-containing protein [Bacteroidia bacterium]